jgi:aldehyde dehydrogenase
MMGAQLIGATKKILSYIKLKEEGAEVLTGGEQNHLEGDLLEDIIMLPLKGIIKCVFSRRNFHPF